VICCHRFCLILQTFNLLLYYDFPLIYICLFAFILFNIRTSLECANILYFTFIFFLFVFVSQSVHIKVYRPVPVHITFLRVRVTVLNATFNNISGILWRVCIKVLLIFHLSLSLCKLCLLTYKLYQVQRTSCYECEWNADQIIQIKMFNFSNLKKKVHI
jgi:hypothetical protein